MTHHLHLAQKRHGRSIDLSNFSSVSLADRIPTNHLRKTTVMPYPYSSIRHPDLSVPQGHLVRGALQITSDDEDVVNPMSSLDM